MRRAIAISIYFHLILSMIIFQAQAQVYQEEWVDQQPVEYVQSYQDDYIASQPIEYVEECQGEWTAPTCNDPCDPSWETPWIKSDNDNFFFKNTCKHSNVPPTHYPKEFQSSESLEEGVDEELTGVSYREISFEPIKEDKKGGSSNLKLHDNYRLQIGDIFLISLYGEEGSQQEVIVDPTGHLTYLYVTEVPVFGKTINEVREILEEKLSQYYRYVVLAITPIQITGQFYTVLGEVKAPGKKQILGHTTVTSALADSGGFTHRIFRNRTTDNADLERSFLSRGGEIVPVDFEALIQDGDFSQDVELQEGDYIYVAASTQKEVYVLGEVGASRVIDFLTCITLSEAIAQAGGLGERASSRVAVIRGSLGCPIKYLIDINRIVKGYACDFCLQPGDIVYVPARKFTTLREIFREAVSVFVSTTASFAGTNAFIKIQPNAAGTVVSPIPTVPTASVQTFNFPTGTFPVP